MIFCHKIVRKIVRLTPSSLRGGHNDPPGKNLRDSFVCNLFRTPFSEKKVEWTKKILPSKKIRKKYMGGPPNHRTWPKSKKIFPKISICRFAVISPYEEINSI